VDRLATSLSESILTVLAFDNSEKSNLIAGLVDPKLFESYYVDLCTRILDFRRNFNEAPGTAHLDDVFDHVLSEPTHRLHTIYAKILQGLIDQHRSGINVDYVASRVSEFTRQQTLKSGILQAAQLIQQGGDDLADDIEKVLLETVQKKVTIDDPGVRLSDKQRAFKFLDQAENDYCKLGIVELDKRRLNPTRKELFVFIAPRKRGKSMFAIHAGKMALLQRWKVLHITLEMAEEIVVQRYYQSLFSMSKRNEKSLKTYFELDDLHHVNGFKIERTLAKLNLEDAEIRQKLSKRIDIWGTRLSNVLVKQFPTGDLTLAKLEAYLDSMEIAEKFIPDMVIIDYPALMRLRAEHYTHDLGQVVVGLRGIAVKRNLAMLILAQGNRASESAETVGSDSIAGDISIISTCDVALTHSQTQAERQLGLARLLVSQARNDEDRFSILVSQNYATGQFAIDSAPMTSNYIGIVEMESGKIMSGSDDP
jgi:replicative DNA helicase